MLTLIAVLLEIQICLVVLEPGVFSKALWFLHEFGTVECTTTENDSQIKGVLAKALANDRVLTYEEVQGLIQRQSFEKHAGKDLQLTELEMSQALELSTPVSRSRLDPKLVQHAEFLSTSFDMIEPQHHSSMEQLTDWIASHWQSDRPLHVIVTCTGNSRRSMLGAAMGNLAAAYYGLENVHFHSGGTAPSAFNKRTIATLKEIGFQIEPTGKEATRGDPKTPNPMYRLSWGKDFEAMEFSKSYKDASNPQSGFAAIMVCNEADAECPIVAGAALRVAMKFLDPKVYDDGDFESKKYAERRDDIGRTFMCIMANARKKVHDKNRNGLAEK